MASGVGLLENAPLLLGREPAALGLLAHFNLRAGQAMGHRDHHTSLARPSTLNFQGVGVSLILAKRAFLEKRTPPMA